MLNKSKIIKSSVLAIISLLFVACGSSDNSTIPATILPISPVIETVKEAKLIDSAIQGVDYTTESRSGTTSDDGTFKYSSNDKTITFKIGNLVLANDFNLSKLNSDKLIFPADIFGVNRNNITDENVLKFIRVVQSLDNDNNASNGILIDDNTKNLIIYDIDIKDANISTLITIIENTSNTFILESDAVSHYKSTLENIEIDFTLSSDNNESYSSENNESSEENNESAGTISNENNESFYENNETSPSLTEGQLIDSYIQGVEYITNTQSGTTNEIGVFKYASTDTNIKFKLGNFTLADFNLSKLNSDKLIFPSDLFNLDRNNTTNIDLLKFIRVVQSLDNDNNASNGILIDDNTKNLLINNINLQDINISEIQTMINNTQKVFKSENEALTHYRQTLSAMHINDEQKIIHNEITYYPVTSPYTNKVWIDRNVGASKLCTSLNDSECYGGYYQWGRNSDGHQLVTSTQTTFTLASDINANNINDAFIKLDPNTATRYDWLESGVDDNGSLRSANWSKIDGSSICPIGYRVPTKDELNNETINLSGDNNVTNRDDAFNNFLKIPSSGYKNHEGIVGAQGEYSVIWTSSVDENKSSRHNFFSDMASSFFGEGRFHGFSVRCIKD